MKIYCSTITLPGTVLQNKNTLPRFRDREQNRPFIDVGLLENERNGFGYQTGFRELPYTEQDGYQRELSPREMSTVVLENDTLRATFLADFGGRLWSLYDKKSGRELLFSNPVFRLANLAIRNAWFSGGIEWNLGQYGHTCLTCEPVFFAKCTDKNGNPFLRMYEYERQKCFFLQIDFHLPDGAGYLSAHVKIQNTKQEPVPLYWWTNIAVKEEKNVRVFSGSSDVICLRPEAGDPQKSVNGFAHDTMPFLKNLNGVDASYPQNLFYSNEYFFQNRKSFSDTWEAAVYSDGNAFWERSTPVLRYRKMFCWGVQRGGKHWKDFLSREGEGNYLEIQAGLSPTQVHGEDLEANGCVRFTQAFGGLKMNSAAASGDWETSKCHVRDRIDGCLDPDTLTQSDKEYQALEDIIPDEILHSGSGWGALEAMRDPDCIPKGLLFPEETIGERQEAWLVLLKTGRMPEPEKTALPISWITDSRWMYLLARSLKKQENQNATAWLHYGVMLRENRFLPESVDAFKRSMQIAPSAICCRNLAQAALQDNHPDAACEYITEGLKLGGAGQSEGFARDAIDLLTAAGRYSEAWSCYCGLSDEQKSAERIRLGICRAAFQMQQWNFLEKQFASDFAVIREGENMLLELWFEYQALRLAQERGRPADDAMLAEVKASAAPPYNLDFRMK